MRKVSYRRVFEGRLWEILYHSSSSGSCCQSLSLTSSSSPSQFLTVTSFYRSDAMVIRSLYPVGSNIFFDDIKHDLPVHYHRTQP